MTYNKLVRDRIPEIIHAKGGTCKTRILSDEEYAQKLDQKLGEELAEFLDSHNPEELADLLAGQLINTALLRAGMLDDPAKLADNSQALLEKLLSK